MARALRSEYAGAVYHVMARANQGWAIFANVKDRQHFLDTLGEACGKTGEERHAPPQPLPATGRGGDFWGGLPGVARGLATPG
jgi:hypothetical protein